MISICIIMKNEEKFIGQCLDRICSLGWEIVVVDTGSTDSSKEIALKYTDKVYYFKWINDFSAARNFAAEKAENDFIFALDSDEFVESIDQKAVEELIKSNPTSVLCPLRINKFEQDGTVSIENERISRIYSRKIYRYTGKIHEQVERIDGKDNTYLDAPVSMDHLGYFLSSEEKIKKAQRNIDLLNIELESNPNDPYILYQLGKSYFMQKNYKDAISSFEKFLIQKPNLALEYVENGIESYCWCLIKSEEYKKALDVFKQYDGLFNDTADFEFLAGHIFLNNGMISAAAERFLQATECKKFKVHGTNSYSAFYNIGVIFECCNQKDIALEYYEMCGDYEPAVSGIERINTEIKK